MAIPPVIVILALALVIGPWSRTVNLMDARLSVLCHINAGIWLVVLWWAGHHLVFQMASLFERPAALAADLADGRPVRFVVMYLTCDDFQENACHSIVAQDCPAADFRILICDDSSDSPEGLGYRSLIKRFADEHRVQVITRPDRTGFKAGNFNHALAFTSAKDEWVLVVDADQTLPENYLRRMAAAIRACPVPPAFIQGANSSDHQTVGSATSTRFQAGLGNEVDLFYQRSLPMRNRFGFLPFLGHGAVIRRDVLIRLGGLPEVVSEDYAFSARLRAAGEAGIYVESVSSWESFPKDFGAFVTRLTKFAGGSADLLKSNTGELLRSSKIGLGEKIDFVMLLLWYPLCPLALANCYLSGYVCHHLWTASNRIPFLHPVLPYLFIVMFVFTISVLFSASRDVRDMARYWFWSTAVYAATLPITVWEFVTHLWRRPKFVRTPKGDARAESLFWRAAIIAPAGALTLYLSKAWYSPFSLILASYGAAFLCFPAFTRLADSSIWGRLARLLVLAPGALFLGGMYAMWTRGKF